MDETEIDFEQLLEDLKGESYGAFWGGNFGGALFEVIDLTKATPEEIINEALNRGIDLNRYQIMK